MVFRNSLVSHDLFKEVNHCATRSHMNKSMQLVRVRWNKPMEGCHKLSYSVDAELCVLRDGLLKYININSLAVENEIMQR